MLNQYNYNGIASPFQSPILSPISTETPRVFLNQGINNPKVNIFGY